MIVEIKAELYTTIMILSLRVVFLHNFLKKGAKNLERHVLSVLVRNSSGVLTRVSGLFAMRGFNIDILTVGRTEKEEISRMTIVLMGNDDVLEQFIKQLNKLEDVLRVHELVSEHSI